MSTPLEAHRSAKPTMVSIDVGASLVALAGAGLVGYGVMFLIRNFYGFTELGLSAASVGGTPEQIQAFSPNLYHYISHLHVALSGFIIALGVAVIALALFGIRRKHAWALWTAFVAPMIAIGIALPLHYPYGLAAFGHLGLSYLVVAVLLVGTVISLRAAQAA